MESELSEHREFFLIRDGELLMRRWTRDDIDRIALWSGYPPPYDIYNVEFSKIEKGTIDSFFAARQKQSGVITLVIDHENSKSVGAIAMFDFDRQKKSVGNIGVRIAPDWCDKGIGSRFLKVVSERCFESGIETIRLDAASWNTRAIKCYEKAGFNLTGEFFYKEAEYLDSEKLSGEYSCIAGHAIFENGAWSVRHEWLERKK
ncbi:MAG TPA: N-acetyltransferase [Firmicutes bacterium]|nr:N-acetyltransferase [Bacillota bacterium]